MGRKPQFDSLVLCSRAIETLKSWELPPDPKAYEIAYLYVEGSSVPLNRAIDTITKFGRKLSIADIARLRELHLPLERMAGRVSCVGEKLKDEIDQVVGMIEAAIGLNANHRDTLHGSSHLLSASIDRETLYGIVESILTLAKDVQQENHLLGFNLEQSRDDISKLQNDLVAARAESLTDPLTGVANRKRLDQFLSEILQWAYQTRRPLTFLLADVDHFKRFNDNFGHLTGDYVLRFLAEILRKNLKGTDFVARYGGEEFAVVLPDTTLEQGRIVAEKLRRVVENTELVKRSTGETLGRVSLSIGISTWHIGEDAKTLIEIADVCLYEAKRRGRNCIVFEGGREGQEKANRKAS